MQTAAAGWVEGRVKSDNVREKSAYAHLSERMPIDGECRRWLAVCRLDIFCSCFKLFDCYSSNAFFDVGCCILKLGAKAILLVNMKAFLLRHSNSNIC